MEIKKLTWTGIEPMKAQAFYNNKGDRLFFNVKHGTEGKLFGYWLGRVSPKIAKPKDISDTYVFDKNNYVLIPNRDKVTGNINKDKLGNNIYSIGIDYSTIHQNDIILFWEIPNKNYKDVNFEINGDANLIGMAYNGKDRGDDNLHISPAPVVEIYGNCTLTWKAININNDEIYQTAKYNYNNGVWEISPVLLNDETN